MTNRPYQVSVSLTELYGLWVFLLVSGTLIILCESGDGDSPNLDGGLGPVVVDPLNEVVQVALLGAEVDFTCAPDADGLTERGVGDQGGACHNQEDNTKRDENYESIVHKKN